MFTQLNDNKYNNLLIMDGSQTKINVFKYVLYPGNNPSVIQEALNKRKVWAQIPPQKILLANFAWKPLNYPSSLYDKFDEIMRFDKNRVVFLNHFENNAMICTKSGLVRSLKHYYSHQNAIYGQNYHVFETIPTTFIVNTNKESQELKDFLERFAELESQNFSKQKIPSKHCEKNIWYIKPQASNQGRGINLTNNLKEIESIIFAKSTNSSYIIQKAIQKPLLYQKRKFDVRVWALVTGSLEIYFYKTPYIRTSSYQYNDTEFDQNIHLTNNCQQKHFSEYSKFQQGNTIPFDNLKQILLQMGKSDASQLVDKILERMKSLVVDCILSVRKLFLRNVKKKEFELFGFDFLIDEDLRTWLLEVNNNPYLGIPNKFIKQMLPQMINQMMQIILDPHFPPIDYEPVQHKKYQLLHKQISFYRINPIRSGSTDNKRKDYYPLEQFSSTHSRDMAVGKSRRNSDAVGSLGSFQNTQKNMKIRYSTPVESVKYLLDTYCFSDLEPFLVPVNFILSSPKLEDKESVQVNVRNVKLITETRICHILLQPKFLLLCKKIFQSQTHCQQIKICLFDGYSNSIRNHRNRVAIIKNIVPTYRDVLKIHGRKFEKNQQNKPDPLIESMILLLIRLGGIVNRKIFIPGQTREKQNSRQFFIVSSTMKLLMQFKQNYSYLCQKQMEELFSNMNEKDWELYHSVERGEQNIALYDQQKTEKIHIENRANLNLTALQDNNHRKSGYRERFQTTNFKNPVKLANISLLPKIKK